MAVSALQSPFLPPETARGLALRVAFQLVFLESERRLQTPFSRGARSD